jgi:hypothetical protein
MNVSSAFPTSYGRAELRGVIPVRPTGTERHALARVLQVHPAEVRPLGNDAAARRLEPTKRSTADRLHSATDDGFPSCAAIVRDGEVVWR